MSTQTFAGQSCLDPLPILEACAQQGLPTDWAGMANTFFCPLGMQPGQGWVLLSRASLATIDRSYKFTGLYPLVFRLDHTEIAGVSLPTQKVSLQNLVFVRSRCVTPGRRGDPACAYLVEIADRRYLYRHIPIDTAFNTRDPFSGSYLSVTLNSGVAWTWDQMGSSVWGTIGTSKLGAWPGFPFAPDGTPEDFVFWGMSAWDALGLILARLNCALKLNPLSDTFSIVRLGASDAAATAALSKWDSYRILDDDPLQSLRARIPAQVRVLFRKVPLSLNTAPYYSILVSDPTANAVTSGFETGTAVDLYDSLNALYSSGSLTNLAALTSRANQRALDYYTEQWNDTTGLRRIYGLPLSEPGLLPGAQIRSIRWGDSGSGLKTEIVRAPADDWLDSLSSLPLVHRGDGGTTNIYNDPRIDNTSVWPTTSYAIEAPLFLTWTAIDTWDLTTFNLTWNATGSGTVITAGIGTQWNTEGVLIVNAPIEICGVMFWCCYTVPAWTTDQNNWSVPNPAVVYRISSTNSTSINLTGMAPFNVAGTPYPQVVALVNVSTDAPFTANGAETIILKHQNAGSIANNRFTLPGSTDLILQPQDAVILWYDYCQWAATGTGTWRVLARGQTQITRLNGLYNEVNLVAGANITITPTVGNPSTITIAATAATQSKNQVFATNSNLTNAYANVGGLSMSLAAGTYLIICDLMSVLAATLMGSQNASIYAQLYDATAAAAIANSERQNINEVHAQESGETEQRDAPLSMIITLTATHTINVQAKYVTLGTVSTASIGAGSSMIAVQILQ